MTLRAYRLKTVNIYRCLNPACPQQREWRAHTRLVRCPRCGGELAVKPAEGWRDRERE